MLNNAIVDVLVSSVLGNSEKWDSDIQRNRLQMARKKKKHI